MIWELIIADFCEIVIFCELSFSLLLLLLTSRCLLLGDIEVQH